MRDKKETFWFPSAIYTESIAIVLFLLFAIYAILGVFGYGNDRDTYLMLRSGRDLFLEGTYNMSRQPGYIIPEIIIGGASLIGGHFLTNLISSFLGSVSLYLFWRLLKRCFSNYYAILITVIVGLNPYFVIAASSSIDYVYSIFFILFGITALTERWFFTASIMFTLAVSSRLLNILIIVIIYLYFFYIEYKNNEKKGMIRVLLSAALMGSLIIIIFILSFKASGITLEFPSYIIRDWSFFEHLSRFVYKNICLFGLFPFLLLLAMAIYKVFKRNLYYLITPEVIAGLTILLFHEILFFKVPFEISYLLPMLFVVIPIFIKVLQARVYTMYVLLGLIVLYGFVFNLDILDIKYKDKGTEAISVNVGLFLRSGVIFSDVFKRESSREIYSKEYNILIDN